MKLSAAFIADHLEKNYKVYKASELSTEPLLINPALYFPRMKLLDYTVYVINKNQVDTLKEYERLPKNCLFVVVGDVNIIFPNVCILEDNVEPLEVFSNIQELFNTYNTWQDDLVQAYLKGKSIETLLKISVPVLKNSLFVTGMDFTILASAYMDPSIPHENIFGSTQRTHTYVTALKSSKLYQQVKELNNVFYFPSHVTGLASLCVNIKQNNRTTHRLVMLEDNRKIEKNEGFLLEFLARLIERILNPRLVRNFNESNNSDFINLANIFLEILSNENVDYMDIGQKFSAEGWLPEHQYICLCIKLTEADKRNYTYYPIIYYLKNIFNHSCPLLYKGNVVVYINMSLSKLSYNEVIEYIKNFAEMSLLKVGVSRIMSAHIYLHYQYIQTQIALSLGMEKWPDRLVYTFNDVSFDYLLEQATKEMPPSMVVHEKLLQLIESDRTKNTEYIKTLSMYFNNQFNAQKTAEKLFIHRSTLMYRLDKIKKILGCNFTDPDEVLYIMLSLRLLDYLQNIRLV